MWLPPLRAAAELGDLGRAQVAGHLVAVGAARVERAAGRRVEQARRVAGDRDQAGLGVAGHVGHAREQAPRVGHLRVDQDLLAGAVLDHASGVHHQDVVGHLGDDPQVVRDDDDGGVELTLQVLQEVQDLRLDGHVEGRRRLVGDQQARVVDQPHRDHRALPHAAGELVRVVVHPAVGLGDAHPVEHLHRTRLGGLLADVVVHQVGLGDLVAHRVVRVHRRERVLEDHRDVTTAPQAHLLVTELQQIGVVEEDLAAHDGVGAPVETEDRRAGDRLAGSRLTHDAERLSPLEVERHSIGGLDDAVHGREMDLEVLDRQERRHVCRFLSVGGARQPTRTRGSMKA